jgi:hypothetical protein
MPGAVSLKKVNDKYVGKLEAVSYCGDQRQRVVGQLWHTIDVNITEENYQRYMGEGIMATLRMKLSGPPRYVKTVLYDYGADRVGSAVRELKKR